MKLCFLGIFFLFFMAYGDDKPSYHFISFVQTPILDRNYFNENVKAAHKLHISHATFVNCGIERIERDAFIDFPALELINLSNNKILEANFVVKTLTHLILRDNLITEQPNLENFPKLLFLNLSGNYLKSIDYEGGKYDEHPLAVIDVSNNPINEFDVSLDNKYIFKVLFSKPLQFQFELSGKCSKFFGKICQRCSKSINFIGQRKGYELIATDTCAKSETNKDTMEILYFINIICFGLFLATLFVEWLIKRCRNQQNPTVPSEPMEVSSQFTPHNNNNNEERLDE